VLVGSISGLVIFGLGIKVGLSRFELRRVVIAVGSILVGVIWGFGEVHPMTILIIDKMMISVIHN